MIRVGVNYSSHITPELIRYLVGHPDVELSWVAGATLPEGGITEVFDELQGEMDYISSAVDFSSIDLFIGEDSSEVRKFLEDYPDSKAIVFVEKISGQDDRITGVCEYNRKALVRGGRIAVMPDVPTLLGALALMPLAKNLMLNSAISGTMLLPCGHYSHKKFQIEPSPMDSATFMILEDKILRELQTSFNAPIEITALRTSESDVAMAVINTEIKMNREQAMDIYRAFYSDHRHIAFPSHSVNDAMVRGTNKTVINLGNDSLGRLVITLCFDARIKGGAGNVMHLLNLLFGLDERIGF